MNIKGLPFVPVVAVVVLLLLCVSVLTSEKAGTTHFKFQDLSLKQEKYESHNLNLHSDSAGTIPGNLPTQVQTQEIPNNFILLLILCSECNSFKFAFSK